MENNIINLKQPDGTTGSDNDLASIKDQLQKTPSLSVFKLSPEAVIPTRTNSTDAGLDLYALQDTFLKLNSTNVVKTGVAIKIPVGYVGKIEDRSGLAAKGLRTGAGVVDALYSGEVGVVLHNLTHDKVAGPNGVPGYQIKKGDRIAQILLYKVETLPTVEITELWSSDRGSNGYGSSGK